MNNTTAEYSIIVEKIDKMLKYCKEISENIKPTVSKNKYEFYEIALKHLNPISRLLRQYDDIYQNELECFIRIKSHISYIIILNCEIKNFGHFDSIKYLLDIFKNLIDAKFKFINDEIPFDEYETQLKKTSQDLYDFDNYFTYNIVVPNPKYEDDFHKLNIAMRG